MNQKPLKHGQIYHIYNRGNNRENLFREKRNYLHFLRLYTKYIVPVAVTYAYCLLPNHFHLLVKIRERRGSGKNLAGFSKGLLDGDAQTGGGGSGNLLGLDVGSLDGDVQVDGGGSGNLAGLGVGSLDGDAQVGEGDSGNQLGLGRPPSKTFGNMFNAYTKAINNGYGRSGSLFEKPFRRKPVQGAAYFWNLVVYIHQNPERHGLVDDFRNWPYSSFDTLTSPKQAPLVARTALIDWFGGTAALLEAHAHDVEFDVAW